jgi:hypothetical protein
MKTNLNLELLKRISISEINFLLDVNKHIDIDKRGKFNYFYIPNFEVEGINRFIAKLDDTSLYTIIPLISMHGKDGAPHIILSKQILISKFSKTEIINEFLLKQLDVATSDFELNLNSFHYLIFKYKKIFILY